MNEWMRFLRRNHLRAKFSIRRDRRSWEKILSRSQALLPFSKLRSDNVFHIYKIYGFKKCSFYHPDNLWERLGGVCYPSFMDVEAEALGGSPVAQGPATAERPDLSSQASSRAIFLIAEAGVWLDCLRKTLQKISEYGKSWPGVWWKKTRVSICFVLSSPFFVLSHESCCWSLLHPWDMSLTLHIQWDQSHWSAPIPSLINDGIGTGLRSSVSWVPAPAMLC